jgi:copper chaperone
MTTRTFDVPGISCGPCKAAIEGALDGLGGVKSATVDIDAKTVSVEGSASDEAITAAIDEAGYEVASVR